MRVFVTGATGFIGSLIVQDLISTGYHVLGLTRSESGARRLESAGAEAYRGDLEDLDSLRRGAARSDAVIHTALNHDFSKFVENCEADRRAIEAIGGVLVGSGRPLIITSGTAMANTAPGELAREDDPTTTSREAPRAASEEAANAVAARGVNVSIVRLPQVHDPLKQGLVTYLIATAKEKGRSAYIGDGMNRWPAVHVGDAAGLYTLALRKQEAGSRYHAVAEEGVPLKAIAEVIGRGLAMPTVSMSPEESASHFGWLAAFAGRDLPASSELTRQRLDWHPKGPGLISDLEQMRWTGA